MSDIGWFLAVGAIVFVLFAALGAGCGSLPNEDTGARLLRTQGFEHVRYTGRSVWFVGFQGCGKEDVALMHYRAVNPRGQAVTVDVCQGWPFKGATVRGQ